MAVETREWRTPAAVDVGGRATPADVGHEDVVVFRYSGRQLAALGGSFLLLCLVFWRAIGWLWNTWTDLPEYSHGPMLPMIAAFLIWQQKDRLERLEFHGSWWGPAVAALAGALYFLGVLGSTYTLQQYALVVAIVGLALALTGGPAFRMLLMPLLALVLMVPQPQFILSNLSSELQLVSSSLGVAILRVLGITVFLEGNVIDLGSYKLQVVDACAGLRYLFPLMAMALLVAYFYKGAMWKRVVVFLASVPLTILMNSVRVATIGVLVEHWGGGMADGFLHDFQGWAVFMLSALVLVGITALLNRVGVEHGTWRQLFGLEFPRPTPATARVRDRRLPLPFVASMAVVMALGASSSFVAGHAELPPERQSFATFPLRIGDWMGVRRAIEPDLLGVLQLDDYVLADYRGPAGVDVNFYVAYYATQRDRRTTHSPRSCLPGGGWRINESGPIDLTAVGRRANRMVIANGEARALVYYWFEQRGRNLTNEYAVKWWLFWDAVSRSRSDGALVRLITPLSPTEPVSRADERLRTFIGHAAPLLPAYVPN